MDKKPLKTLQSLQVLRGLAATLVIVAHAIDSTRVIGHSHIASFHYFGNFGAIGTDIFFVISGVIMTIITASNRLPPKQFLLKRCVRILPLYWALSLVYYLISFSGFWPRVGRETILKTIVVLPLFDAGQFIMPVIFLGWTLSFEFLFYIIYTIAIWIDRQRAFYFVFCALLLLVAAGYFLPGVTGPRFGFASNPIILEFLLGCIAGRMYLASTPSKPGFAYGMLVAGIIIFGWNIVSGYGNISEMETTLDGSLSLVRVLKWGIGSFLLVVGLVLLEKSGRFKTPKIFVTVGDISYSAYLLHLFCVALITAVWTKMGFGMADAFILIAVSLSLLVAYACYRLVEKPLTGYLNKKFGDIVR